MGNNPSQFKGDPNRPVEWVTRSDAAAPTICLATLREDAVTVGALRLAGALG
jgi:hypothetical protein